jgi:APA family basic amino acid/polyamine antiporter
MRHPLHQPEPNILKPGLERSVSLAEAVIYGVGIIVGAGIYALIGEAAGIAGNSMWISFLLAAIVASFTALSYCELSSMFPRSAAEYTYVKHAFKSNMFGFLMGWVSIFAAMVGISAVSLGFAGYFSMLFGTPIALTAISLIALLSIVNFLGVKESARLNLVFTIIAVLGLVVIIFMALPFFGSVDYLASTQPGLSLPETFNNIAIAAALIFFAFIGFEDVANISEETVNARQAVPKAILISLIISTILYILVSVSVVSIVPWHALSSSQAPISLVAGAILGQSGSIIFSFIALFATASTVLITLVAVSRLIYGMSSDHSLPGLASKIHSKTKTPFVAITFTSIIAMLFVLSGSLKQVAFISNFGVFALFLMVNLAAITLRLKQPNRKRAFKVPCNIGKIPVFSVLGVVTILFMMSRIEPSAALLSFAVILLGLPLYFLLKRIK